MRGRNDDPRGSWTHYAFSNLHTATGSATGSTTMSPRLRTAHMTGVSRTRELARSHPEDGVDALRETLRAFEKVSSARSGVRFFSLVNAHREARARATIRGD